MNQNLVTIYILFSLLTLGSPSMVNARGFSGEGPITTVVKQNQDAGSGKCLKVVNSSILKDLGVEVSEAVNKGNKSTDRTSLGKNDPRAKSVATVLGAISSIDSNGNVKRLIKGSKFFFGRPGANNNKRSRQATYGIQLNPGGQNITGGGLEKLGGTNNLALIAHEFGHKVGNSQKGKQNRVYDDYLKHMGSADCKISHYGHKHSGGSNEHFADVFAAYVTNPGLFLNKGDACKKSFDYFKNKLFGEPNLKPRCDSRLASLDSNQSNRVSNIGISGDGNFGSGGLGKAFNGDGASLLGGVGAGIGVLVEKLQERKSKRKKAARERAKALAAERDRNNALIRSAGGVVE